MKKTHSYPVDVASLLCLGAAAFLLCLCLAFCWPWKAVFGYPPPVPSKDPSINIGPYTLWEYLTYDRFPLHLRILTAFLVACPVLCILLILGTGIKILCGKRTCFMEWGAIALCLFFGFYASLMFNNGQVYNPVYSYPHFLLPSYLAAIFLLLSYFLRRGIYYENPVPLKMSWKKISILATISSGFVLAGCLVSLALIWPTRVMFGETFTDYSVRPYVTKGPFTFFGYLAEPHYLVKSKAFASAAFVFLILYLAFAVILLLRRARNKNTVLFPWLTFGAAMTFGFLMKWFVILPPTTDLIVGFLYRIPSLFSAAFCLFVLYLTRRLRETEDLPEPAD